MIINNDSLSAKPLYAPGENPGGNYEKNDRPKKSADSGTEAKETIPKTPLQQLDDIASKQFNSLRNSVQNIIDDFHNEKIEEGDIMKNVSEAKAKFKKDVISSIPPQLRRALKPKDSVTIPPVRFEITKLVEHAGQLQQVTKALRIGATVTKGDDPLTFKFGYQTEVWTVVDGE